MKGIEVMKSMLGLQEKKDKIKLMEFFKKHLHPKEFMLNPETTPWCARIIGCCERAVGKKGTGKDNARSYLDYGTRVRLDEAEPGDICIFMRGNSTWQGHVAYFVDQVDDESIVVLGGNQKDSICYGRYPVHNLLGIRRS